MSTRIAPGHGRSRKQRRGQGRGMGAGREGIIDGASTESAVIKGVAVRRPGYGTKGDTATATVNLSAVEFPSTTIYHYDVAITPTRPVLVSMEIIKQLQSTASDVFTNRVAYDGKKFLYASSALPLGSSDSAEFQVTIPVEPNRVFTVLVTKVQEINTECLRRFLDGKQAEDSQCLSTYMAYNTVTRVTALEKGYPFNLRHFFTEKGALSIGGGLQLQRGHFQSIRPGIGRLFVNNDISAAVMYNPGPLVELFMDYLGKKGDPATALDAKKLAKHERFRLQSFIVGLKVEIPHIKKTKAVRGIAPESADMTFFTTDEGKKTNVTAYFKTQWKKTLKYPKIICVTVGNNAVIPLELCEVPPGQLTRKPLPQDKTSAFVQFSTMRPKDRMECIKEGREVLAYGQSEYVRQFGLNIKNTQFEVRTRLLPAPKLQCAQATFTPQNGQWNLLKKNLHRPATIKGWLTVVLDPYFRVEDVDKMHKGILASCGALGISVQQKQPAHTFANGQGDIAKILRTAYRSRTKCDFIIVILPGVGNADMYRKVKHFGDITDGIPTQCLLGNKVMKASAPYWANVLLKVNAKLGGINFTLAPHTSPLINDPNNPTIIMGADVIDPPTRVHDQPSFAALVYSNDSTGTNYKAITDIQPTRRQMIAGLYDMSKTALSKFMAKNGSPKHLIFFRDGVSEGELQQVLDQELPRIKRACEELKIKPKITLIVVGKRHHIKFTPKDATDADKSGNCKAGVVVDSDICHPTDFDFYLQSHGGLLGHSRSAHYTVLYDDNNFTVDSMQMFCNAMCNTYVKATRSVSIPAPVYYADTVCARAKHHYDPMKDVSDSGYSEAQADGGGIDYQRDFLPLHTAQRDRMYFV